MLRSFFILIVLALSLAGCFTPELYEECNSDIDCKAGFTCEFSNCVPESDNVCRAPNVFCDETCVEQSVDHCGGCAPCPNLPGATATACDADTGRCTYECDAAFVDGDSDLNQPGSNGCECAAESGAEVCDGVDNDCNGVIDDNIAVSQETCPGVAPENATPNACVDGACTYVCADNYTTVPVGQTPTATAGCTCFPTPDNLEICDGLDNDCDGVVDNDMQTSGAFRTRACPDVVDAVATACEQGACVYECKTVEGLDYQPADGVNPANGCVLCGDVEICGDGIDNDCDQAVDFEDTDLASVCPNGGGVCAGTVPLCVDAQPECSEDAFAAHAADQGKAYEPYEGLCDGEDNDCDGVTDEICCDEPPSVLLYPLRDDEAPGAASTLALSASGTGFVWVTGSIEDSTALAGGLNASGSIEIVERTINSSSSFAFVEVGGALHIAHARGGTTWELVPMIGSTRTLTLSQPAEGLGKLGSGNTRLTAAYTQNDNGALVVDSFFHNGTFAATGQWPEEHDGSAGLVAPSSVLMQSDTAFVVAVLDVIVSPFEVTPALVRFTTEGAELRASATLTLSEALPLENEGGAGLLAPIMVEVGGRTFAYYGKRANESLLLMRQEFNPQSLSKIGLEQEILNVGPFADGAMLKVAQRGDDVALLLATPAVKIAIDRPLDNTHTAVAQPAMSSFHTNLEQDTPHDRIDIAAGRYGYMILGLNQTEPFFEFYNADAEQICPQ